MNTWFSDELCIEDDKIEIINNSDVYFNGERAYVDDKHKTFPKKYIKLLRAIPKKGDDELAPLDLYVKLHKGEKQYVEPPVGKASTHTVYQSQDRDIKVLRNVFAPYSRMGLNIINCSYKYGYVINAELSELKS
jgi:hypothetical protein